MRKDRQTMEMFPELVPVKQSKSEKREIARQEENQAAAERYDDDECD